MSRYGNFTEMLLKLSIYKLNCMILGSAQVASDTSASSFGSARLIEVNKQRVDIKIKLLDSFGCQNRIPLEM